MTIVYLQLYYDPVTGRQFRSKNDVLSFLETGKLPRRRRRSKTTSEGKDGDETKDLSGTPSEFDSSASNIDGTSGSSDLLLHNNHSALPSNSFPIAPIVPQFIPTATTMSSFPNPVASQCATDPRMTATCPILVSSPSSSMLSSITGRSDLLVHNNHTASPSNPFPTVPIVPHSGTLISSVHDSVASQSTFASMMSDTMTRHLAGNSDLLVHSNHTAFPSNPFTTVPIVPQSGTLISNFHDSVASQSTSASMMSDTMTRQLAGTYDLLFRNEHAARLPSYPRPMFGFTALLEAVINANIPTALPTSRLHSSTILQSANNPDTISTPGKMPTKFQSLLDGAEGSKVHIFAEGKPTESSKKKRKPFIFTEKPTGSSKKERKPCLDLKL